MFVQKTNVNDRLTLRKTHCFSLYVYANVCTSEFYSLCLSHKKLFNRSHT